MDIQRSPTLPRLSPTGLRNLANAPTVSHENTGIIIVAGASALVKMLYDLFSRLYPTAAEKYHLVESMDKAEAIHAQNRSL